MGGVQVAMPPAALPSSDWCYPTQNPYCGGMAPRAESRTLRGGCYAAGPLGPKGVPLLEGCGELLGGEILGVGDHCVVCCVCGSAAGGAVARASLRKRGFCSGWRGAEVSRPGSLIIKTVKSPFCSIPFLLNNI